jgi:hypothetical protein
MGQPCGFQVQAPRGGRQVTCSNGLSWTADGASFLYIDSTTACNVKVPSRLSPSTPQEGGRPSLAGPGVGWLAWPHAQAFRYDGGRGTISEGQVRRRRPPLLPRPVVPAGHRLPPRRPRRRERGRGRTGPHSLVAGTGCPGWLGAGPR